MFVNNYHFIISYFIKSLILINRKYKTWVTHYLETDFGIIDLCMTIIVVENSD